MKAEFQRIASAGDMQAFAGKLIAYTAVPSSRFISNNPQAHLWRPSDNPDTAVCYGYVCNKNEIWAGGNDKVFVDHLQVYLKGRQQAYASAKAKAEAIAQAAPKGHALVALFNNAESTRIARACFSNGPLTDEFILTHGLQVRLATAAEQAAVKAAYKSQQAIFYNNGEERVAEALKCISG